MGTFGPLDFYKINSLKTLFHTLSLFNSSTNSVQLWIYTHHKRMQSFLLFFSKKSEKISTTSLK